MAVAEAGYALYVLNHGYAEGFYPWRAGGHTPGGGRARCGGDLTAVIGDSPHGRSKLKRLEKVGTIE